MAEMENLRRRTEKEVADSADIMGRQFSPATCRDLRRQSGARHRERPERRRRRVQDADRGRPGDRRRLPVAPGAPRREEDRTARPEVRSEPARGPFEIPDESVAAGTVLQVMEDGLHYRRARAAPAKVGVQRGGLKAEHSPEPARSGHDHEEDERRRSTGANSCPGMVVRPSMRVMTLMSNVSASSTTSPIGRPSSIR